MNLLRWKKDICCLFCTDSCSHSPRRRSPPHHFSNPLLFDCTLPQDYCTTCPLELSMGTENRLDIGLPSFVRIRIRLSCVLNELCCTVRRIIVNIFQTSSSHQGLVISITCQQTEAFKVPTVSYTKPDFNSLLLYNLSKPANSKLKIPKQLSSQALAALK